MRSRSGPEGRKKKEFGGGRGMRARPRQSARAFRHTPLPLMPAKHSAQGAWRAQEAGDPGRRHDTHPLSSISIPFSEETACRFCAAALPDWKGVLTPQETELAGGMPYVAPTMSVTFNGEVRREREDGRKGREKGPRVIHLARARPRASVSTPSHFSLFFSLLFSFRSTTSSSRAAPAGTRPSSATSAASSASGPMRRWPWRSTARIPSQARW